MLDYNTSGSNIKTSSQNRIRREVRRRELIVVVESNGAAKKEKLTAYSRRPNHFIDNKPFPIRTDHFNVNVNACDKCHVMQSCCCSIETEKKLMYIKEMSRLLAEAAAKVKKQNTRCVFWPNCEKADQCPFLHPTKPCLVFPNCPFGPACHYIHPACRYDGFCARFDCPFTHYGIFSTSKASEQPTTAINESINVLIDSNINDNRANIIKSLPIVSAYNLFYSSLKSYKFIAYLILSIILKNHLRVANMATYVKIQIVCIRIIFLKNVNLNGQLRNSPKNRQRQLYNTILILIFRCYFRFSLTFNFFSIMIIQK